MRLAAALSPPRRSGQSWCRHLELRELHYAGNQFSDRCVLHFPSSQGDEQDETPGSRRTGRFKGLSGLRDADPNKGQTLSTLHD